MNSKIVFTLCTAASLVLLSCGVTTKDLRVEGSIDIPVSVMSLSKGPVFAALSRTGDPSELEKDPVGNIIRIVTADQSNRFSFDLKDTGLSEGDFVYCFAFIDNDYREGIPYPTTGDIAGFYINKDTFETKIKLQKGTNSIAVSVNRVQYPVDAAVTGTVEGPDDSSVIIIGYAGELLSMDMHAIDTDKIVAYKIIEKTKQSQPFSMDILPYGFPTPISNVYFFAINPAT